MPPSEGSCPYFEKDQNWPRRHGQQPQHCVGRCPCGRRCFFGTLQYVQKIRRISKCIDSYLFCICCLLFGGWLLVVVSALVPEDVAIPAGEHWGGSPAIRVVSGWSQDAHEPKPTEEAGGGEVTAELDQTDQTEQMEHKEEGEAEVEAEVDVEVEAEVVGMVHTARNTARSNITGSNSATVVPITTPPSPPSPTTTQVRSASTSGPPNPPLYRQRQRPHMFPCWISVLQVLIIVLSTVISIVIYLPSLIILVNVLMTTMPDSVPAFGPCRATVYCQNDLICTSLPSVVTQNNGRLGYRSSAKSCIGEQALEALAANVTARMEIDQASHTCQPVNARTSCVVSVLWLFILSLFGPTILFHCKCIASVLQVFFKCNC